MFSEKDSVIFRSGNIGQVIRNYREFLGLSRKDFGKMFELKVDMLRRIEETVHPFKYPEATELLLDILHCEYEAEDEVVTLDTKVVEFWRAKYLFEKGYKLNYFLPLKERMNDFVKRFTSPLCLQDQVDIFSVLYRWIDGTAVYAFNEEEDTVEEAGRTLWEEVQKNITKSENVTGQQVS